jgi:hypothetical protein
LTFHNRTRRSASIPARLIEEGRFYLVPLYYLLLSSDLAREGIANSGSFAFADHVYAGRPSGRFGVGLLVDALFLSTPSARAMRFRCTAARDEILRFVGSTESSVTRVLAVPCGLARELFEAGAVLRTGQEVVDATGLRTGTRAVPTDGWNTIQANLRTTVEWYGVDLDAELIGSLRAQTKSHDGFLFQVGDAFDPSAYSSGPFSAIVSTGFGEFLDDAQLVKFLATAREQLSDGGILITSAMGPSRFSDYLLRNLGEIHTHYRSAGHIVDLVSCAGFPTCRYYQDATGLQTMVVGRRDG